MAHRNPPLSELGRLRLARCVVEQGWPAARAAERFQVSRATAYRWAQRYRDQGPAGMADRSSRRRISRLRDPDPATGQPVRRYEYGQPGDLVHVDVKRLGNIPARTSTTDRCCRPQWSSSAAGAGP